MSENLDPIEIRIEVPTGDADAGFSAIEKRAKAFGNQTEKASAGAKLAMWGFGEQAQTAAEKMGLPFQMSRKLGNAVEDMGRSLGSAAIAFGGVGFAVMAVVEVYRAFSDVQEKSMQALIAQTQHLYDGASALSEYKFQTLEVLSAKKMIAEQDRQEFLRKAPERIMKEEMELEKLQKQAQNTGVTMKEFWGFIKEETMGEQSLEATRKRLNNIDAERNDKIRDQINLIRQLKAEYQAAQGGGTYSQDVEAANASMRNARNEEFDRLVAYHERERKLRVDAWNDMLTRKRRQTEFFMAEDKRQLDNTRRTHELQWASAQASTGNISNAFAMMYRLGGEHARGYFSMYKVAAASEVAISSARGIMKALALEGPLGWVEAASIAAMGAAQLATIRAQSFDGGSGAVGTYPASSATGLPAAGSASAGDGKTIHVHFDINGREAGSVEILDGVIRKLASTGGSWGGYKISMRQVA